MHPIDSRSDSLRIGSETLGLLQPLEQLVNIEIVHLPTHVVSLTEIELCGDRGDHPAHELNRPSDARLFHRRQRRDALTEYRLLVSVCHVPIAPLRQRATLVRVKTSPMSTHMAPAF